MNTYGYARVSSADQNADRQFAALVAAGIPPENIYTDRRSGRDFARPAWRRLMRKLRKGDLLVVQSIDRMGRNYEEMQEEWRRITKVVGADVQVLDMALLDTRLHRDLLGTLVADLVLKILAYCAHAERDAIRTRQRQGISAAKARGVKFGRPESVPPPGFAEAVRRVRNGEISAREGARLCGMPCSTFHGRMAQLPNFAGNRQGR